MLKRFFEKLCCYHDWEQRYKMQMFEDPNDKFPYETRVTLVCKKCGKIKQIDI